MNPATPDPAMVERIAVLEAQTKAATEALAGFASQALADVSEAARKAVSELAGPIPRNAPTATRAPAPEGRWTMVTEKQIKQLEQPLSASEVRTREQAGARLSYVDGHYVISRANAVFGFDGWGYDVTGIREVYRGERPGKSGETNTVLVFEAQVRVLALGVIREDVGIGQCDASPRALAQGIEKGRKEAVTDALKRALRSFGPSFGLALYDKDQSDVSILPVEALDALDALAEATDVDAWVTSHKALLSTLTAEQKAVVREHTTQRRAALEGSRRPPPDGTGGPRKGPGPAASAEGSARGSSAPGGAPVASLVPEWATTREGMRSHLADKAHRAAVEASVRLHGRRLGRAYLDLAAERLVGLDTPAEDGLRLSLVGAVQIVERWAHEGPVARRAGGVR